MTRPNFTRSMLCLASAVLAGCNQTESITPEAADTGRVILAITSAPPDAACLRLTIKGATSVVRSLPLMQNQNTNLVLEGLPLGQVVFTGEAFGVTCSGVTSESIATYVSEGVPATLVEGQTVSVTIALQRPGRASVAVDFPMCNGTPGQWDGCRGNGCAVCAENLTDFPRYFINHPSCVRNDTCAGQFF